MRPQHARRSQPTSLKGPVSSASNTKAWNCNAASPIHLSNIINSRKMPTKVDIHKIRFAYQTSPAWKSAGKGRCDAYWQHIGVLLCVSSFGAEREGWRTRWRFGERSPWPGSTLKLNVYALFRKCECFLCLFLCCDLQIMTRSNYLCLLFIVRCIFKVLPVLHITKFLIHAKITNIYKYKNAR